MLKCRIWDNVEKKWVTLKSSKLILGDTQDITEKSSEKHERYKIELRSPFKDSNNKYIYEGDLIKLKSKYLHPHGNWAFFRVIYKNGTFVILYVSSEFGKIFSEDFIGFELRDYYKYKTIDLIHKDDIDFNLNKEGTLSIIGNIHDSSDVIKKHQKNIRAYVYTERHEKKA